MTGAWVTFRVSSMVRTEVCDKSTNMPSLFNSLTTNWNKNNMFISRRSERR